MTVISKAVNIESVDPHAQRSFQSTTKNGLEKQNGRSFGEHVTKFLQEVNDVQRTSDTSARDLSVGKKENIHETMLALSHAELSFKLMVQIRNKALEAYQEVMRIPV